MTLQTTNRIKQLGGLSISAPNVAGKMLYDNILGYYSDTLSEIHDKGYAAVASDAVEPYGKAIIDQFSAERITWTERLFNSPADGIKKIFGMQTSKQQYRKEVKLDLAGELDVPCDPQPPLGGATASDGAPSELSNPHFN